MPKRQTNSHIGSSFDDFLKAKGIYEEVHAKALKRALAEQLDDSIATANPTLHDLERKQR